MVVSKWFDYNSYMTNKLAQVQKTMPAMTMADLVKAFADAGFVGDSGAEQHFITNGQYEELSPNAFFNVTEYYRAKAADYYEKDPKKVTDLDVANVKIAFANAKMSAWEHYKMFGNAEGVNPSNGFDTEAYMTAKLEALNAGKAAADKITMADLVAGFQKAGISALEHFMMYGGSGEGEVVQKYEGKIPAAFAVPEEKKVNSDVNIGKTYPLTTGFDDLTGTAGNDTFLTSEIDSKKTLNAGDKIDGGEGTDTLKIYTGAGSANFDKADIKNVEIVRMVGTTGSSDTIDISGNADVEELWLENVSAYTAGAVKLNATQKLGFMGAIAQSTIGYQNVDGKDDSAVLSFNKATVATGLTVDKIENLTFEFAGANDLGTVTAASAATLVVTGNGEADVTVTGNAGLMKNVDTTGFAGDLSLEFGVTVAADFAYKGGAGNEDVTLGNLANAKYNINLGAGDDTLTLGTTTFTAGAKIDGGDGYDTLSIGVAYTAADFKHFSNFEALEVGTGLSQDVSLFKGDIVLGAFTQGTLKNVGDTQDVYLTTTVTDVTVTYDVTAGNPDHTLNLIFDDKDDAANTAVTLTAITADDSLKTLNITSKGTVHGVATDADEDAANVITSISGATGLNTVNIDGDSDLSFITDALTNSLTVNAKEFTGNLIFDGSTAAKNLTVTGGSGDDHITGSALADKLVGGDGNDALVAGAGTVGLDVLEGGKGIDTFDIVGVTFNATVAAATNVTALMVTINDFEAGESITFNTTAATAANFAKYSGTETALNNIVFDIMKEGTVSVKWFVFEENTYVVNNCGVTGTTFADTIDQVVKLVGTKDLSTATFDGDADTLTW